MTFLVKAEIKRYVGETELLLRPTGFHTSRMFLFSGYMGSHKERFPHIGRLLSIIENNQDPHVNLSVMVRIADTTPTLTEIKQISSVSKTYHFRTPFVQHYKPHKTLSHELDVIDFYRYKDAEKRENERNRDTLNRIREHLFRVGGDRV